MRARSARRLAIKWLAAPRGRPRKKIGPIDACGVPFLPPKKPMPLASAGWPVAWNCMRMGCMGFMGCMVRWGIYRLRIPPSIEFSANQNTPLQA